MTFSLSLLSTRLAGRCSAVHISCSLLTISSNRCWLTTFTCSCGNNGSVISSQPMPDKKLRQTFGISQKAIYSLPRWDCSDWAHFAVVFCTGTFNTSFKVLANWLNQSQYSPGMLMAWRTLAHPSFTAAVLSETTWYSGKEGTYIIVAFIRSLVEGVVCMLAAIANKRRCTHTMPCACA